jgi:hypothetical protein
VALLWYFGRKCLGEFELMCSHSGISDWLFADIAYLTSDELMYA